MTPRDLRNIHTIRNSCKNISMFGMALKLPRYFYLLMEKPLGCYFLWTPYYKAALCNQKVPIPISLRWQVRSEKATNEPKANTNHSYHQLSSPWASLHWSNYKIRFSFNQLSRKRWGVRLVDVTKHLPHRVFESWHHH